GRLVPSPDDRLPSAGSRRRFWRTPLSAHPPVRLRMTSSPSSGVPACVLITGATGGIGGALALEYARAGAATLILQGRNRARLEERAQAGAAQGARVILHDLDVRDHDAVRQWLADIGATEAPDLVIANAGVNVNT